MLRRQVTLPFRKPCVHMSPKSMLRHPLAVSNMEEFLPNTHFKEVIGDESADTRKVRRVLACSGKVYYDLLKRKKDENQKYVILINGSKRYILIPILER